jgi:hypothetical protein
MEGDLLMGRKPDYVRKKYAPFLEKTLENALAHRIGQDFPRIGGARIRQLCAEMILEVVNDHVRSLDRIQHGQVMWLGIHVDDPPRRYQRLADTRLVPLVLDLNTPEDIQARLDRIAPGQRLKQKLVRLCEQAYQQNALLSNCDLAELMNLTDGRVANILTAHERETGKLVPRRATLHDVGTGLTHKRIICHKRYAEGKTSDVIAQETYHSMDAVDRYLAQFDRVRHCRQQGMTPERTAFILSCGVTLVNEYLAIDKELEVSK